jgi:hypothetical protein
MIQQSKSKARKNIKNSYNIIEAKVNVSSFSIPSSIMAALYGY